jgi:hypothetical protein
MAPGYRNDFSILARLTPGLPACEQPFPARKIHHSDPKGCPTLYSFKHPPVQGTVAARVSFHKNVELPVDPERYLRLELNHAAPLGR